MVKNSPANAGDSGEVGLIPGCGRSPREGNGNPLQYSCLENPMDREAWQATVHGGHKESDTTERLSLSHSQLPSKCCWAVWNSLPFLHLQISFTLQDSAYILFPGNPPLLFQPELVSPCAEGTKGASHPLPTPGDLITCYFLWTLVFTSLLNWIKSSLRAEVMCYTFPSHFSKF